MDGYISGDGIYAVYNSIDAWRNRTPDDWITYEWWEDNGHGDDYDWNEFYNAFFAVGDVAEHARNDENAHREPNDPRCGIGNYHSSRRVVAHIPSQYDRDNPVLLMGLELEVECANNANHAAQWVLNQLNTDTRRIYCGTERDGSLINGFEIVTGWTGLDVHEKKLQVFKDIPKNLGLTIRNTCGLHVHLDKAKISPLHQLRLVQFIHAPGNEGLRNVVARRSHNNYSKVQDKARAKKDLAQHLRNLKMDGHPLKERYMRASANRVYAVDRYEAVNMTNNRTIEFRLFRGSLDINEIMTAAEFARISWLFTRDTPEKDLTTDKFVEYISHQNHRRETRYLRRTLKAAGFKVRSSENEIRYLLSDFPRNQPRKAV
jgi:hypothetical protein